MRAAILRAATRRGCSRITGPSPASAGGTRVVLPVPGAAVTTTARRSRTRARISGIQGLMGRGCATGPHYEAATRETTWPRSWYVEGTGELAVIGTRMMTAALLAATLASGLASRRFRHVLPHAIAEYGGDTLWAAAVFFGLRLVRPTARRHVIAAAALAIAVAVELSQLAHPPWLDALRHQPGAGLILGYGFLASDLFCYAAGVAFAWGLDAGVQRMLPGYAKRLQ